MSINISEHHYTSMSEHKEQDFKEIFLEFMQNSVHEIAELAQKRNKPIQEVTLKEMYHAGLLIQYPELGQLVVSSIYEYGKNEIKNEIASYLDILQNNLENS